MFTVNQWPVPPPDGWKPLPVYVSRPSRKLEFLSLSHAPVGAYLHWNEETSRYYPCLFDYCSCKTRPRKRVWKGYLHAIPTTSACEAIVEITHAASRGLALRVSGGSVRGMRIILQRATMKKNSLLTVKIECLEAIPEAFGVERDIRRDLLYAWGYDPFGPSPWEVQP